MEELQYKLEGFEGPLDLLLHLIARHRMELYDFNIYDLIDQYLSFIGAIGVEELDPTSEFIEMAARLVFMKSVALLPRHEEAEELERELTGQLIEYHLCKVAARRLADMSQGIHFYVRETADIDFPNDYTLSHEADLLARAFLAVMGRSERREVVDTEPFEPIVTAPIVAVTSRIVYILRGLRRGTIRHLDDLFGQPATRSETVATFLGVLELIKFQRLILDDKGYLSVPDRNTKGVSQ